VTADASLAGLVIAEPDFEEWLVSERERLREQAVEVLAKLLAHHDKTGQTERGIETALKLVAQEPVHEAVHRTLMRLYARQGRWGGALRQYQICVAVLQRELGAEPEAETRRLYQEILQRRASAPAKPDARPPAVTSAPPRARTAAARRRRPPDLRHPPHRPRGRAALEIMPRAAGIHARRAG
jgi:DNA-binding SARP family transcriptional activator